MALANKAAKIDCTALQTQDLLLSFAGRDLQMQEILQKMSERCDRKIPVMSNFI